MLHLKPENGWFGDTIPYFWNGTFHLFYLIDQEHHALPGGRHTWGHLSSRDLIHWEEHPVAIPLGAEGEVDAASCGTGAIIEKDGLFHLFYLGRYIATNGEKRETICHATSRDLITWSKDPGNPISRPPAGYAPGDWRDGFPFWNEEAGAYWMLVTAVRTDAPAARRGGCLALLTSPDLQRWQVEEPFWAPGLEGVLECPDLFRWNGWWYLIYSGSFSGEKGTFYRRSRSLAGPWQSARVDRLDGPLFYAAKTAGDGRRRFLFGWVGTREGDRDAGRIQWGGHGLVRELVQDGDDGTLWLKAPPAVQAAGGSDMDLAFRPGAGSWTIGEGRASAAYQDGLSFAAAGGVPPDALIRFRFRPDGAARRAGIFLRTDPLLTGGYRLSLEPDRGRFVLSEFGPGRTRAEPLCSPLRPNGPELDVTVCCTDSLIEVFVGERHALTARLYDHRGEAMALFVEDGAGTFEGVRVREMRG